MPNRDGSGPFGNGRPGRGMGPCGRGERRNQRGCGFMRRAGWGNGNNGVFAYNRESLLAQKQELESQLKWLNEEIAREK